MGSILIRVDMVAAFTWLIAAVTLLGILLRPRNWPEAVWACLGAVLFLACGAVPFPDAVAAVWRGADVYLFLTGMMMLAELARREGVFRWLASLAVNAAHGSPRRLFTLVYAVGTAVTVLLSNDATAVVLTPAVYAAVKRGGTKPMPYLFICAFIANAASFVLPISNPANLVVYGKHLPPLLPWLKIFLLPSALSIAATYFLLWWISRKELAGQVLSGGEAEVLTREGQFAAWGIAATGVTLLCASAFGISLGLPALVAAAVAVLAATRAKWDSLRGTIAGVSWSVLPLVAGLFILVEALNRQGALRYAGHLLQWCAGLPHFAGSLTAAFGVAGLSNLMNNLPSGLLAGSALQVGVTPAYLRDAVLIGVDLGPNLSVTGSLATVLWLVALRREGEHVNAWQFLRAGAIVMPPALLLAALSSALLHH